MFENFSYPELLLIQSILHAPSIVRNLSSAPNYSALMIKLERMIEERDGRRQPDPVPMSADQRANVNDLIV